MLTVNWRHIWGNICPLIQCELFLGSDTRMFFSVFVVLFGGVCVTNNCIISAEKILMSWHPLSYYPGSELHLKWGQIRLFTQLMPKVNKRPASLLNPCDQASNGRDSLSPRGTGQTATGVCNAVFQIALGFPPLPYIPEVWTLGAVPFSHYAFSSCIFPFVSTHFRPVPFHQCVSMVSLIVYCVYLPFLSLKNYRTIVFTDYRHYIVFLECMKNILQIIT